MPQTPESTRAWWGAFPLAVDEARRWAVGPLRLEIVRLSREIVVRRWIEGDPLDDVVRVGEDVTTDAPSGAKPDRFGFEQTPDVVHVVPALADRPIVNQPEHPFHLPARETATIYVSCPLWLQLRTRVDGPPFYETAIQLPSDTWFGPNTRIGELCYANRTSARVNLENVVFLPQRVVSAVTIRNRSSKRLDLDRLKLPAPNLSLHAGENARLWTEKVTLVREHEDDAAELELSKNPPAEAGATTFVQGPRQKHAGGALLRAFGRMVGRGGFHV